MRHTARALAAPTALVVVLLLAGCGGSGSTVAQDPAQAPTSSTPAESPTPTTQETPSQGASESPTAPPGDATTGDALITLDSPADGAQVSGSFTAKGTANAPEANVPWRILDASGEAVAEGYATAEGWMDKLYPYETSVDVSELEAGDYTFVVEVPDLSDGEGNGAQTVERHITVG